MLPVTASFVPVDDAALALAAGALPPDAWTVADFDGTLLRQNSTTLYLRSLRPRMVARPLLAMLEMAQPWRLLPGADPRWVYRDWVRVLVMTLLLPWSPWLWRRASATIAREHANAGLMQALSVRPPGSVLVATYGFRFLVAPLLDAMGCTWQLCVSAPLLTAFRLRRIGKAEAVRRVVGADGLRQAMLVTDSDDDRDFLPLCNQALLVRTVGETPSMDMQPGYLPLQYMHHCKRRGENTIVRTILYYDLVCLLLAFVPASAHPLPCFVGLIFFQLAFWTIYEVGNWENDILGVRFEERPHIPPGFAQWRGRMRPGQAWAWAAALSVPCALCFTAALTPHEAGAWPDPASAALLYVALLAYLAVSRLGYAAYNRVDTQTRVFVYPLLQLGKGVALAVFLPVSPAGYMLLVSVLLVRQLRYVAYRQSQSREALKLPVNLHIVVCFLLLAAVAAALTRSAPLWFWIVAAAITAWHLQRGRKDLAALRRAVVWLPGRQTSAAAEPPDTVEGSPTVHAR